MVDVTRKGLKVLCSCVNIMLHMRARPHTGQHEQLMHHYLGPR
jgi:hypothetical protein